MSVIGAKTFFFYEGERPPSKHTLKLPDYFQGADVILPRRGVTLLYGNKGPGSLIGAAVRRSASNDIGVCFADVKVDIGNWDANKQNLDNFENCRFLNLPLRANKEILDDINRHWNRWLDQECEPQEAFPRKPSKRMDLLDKLMCLEPYKHLNAVAYDVSTQFGIAKFVTVYKMEAIMQDEINVIPPQTKLFFECPRRD